MRLAVSALQVLLTLTLLLGLSACYETDHEVFGPKDAAIVPGLAGDYVGDNEEYVVAPVPHTSDYTFRDPKHPEDGFIRFRAVALGGNLYLMQMQPHPQKSNVYWHIIFRVDRAGNGRVTQVAQLEPKEDMVAALARQFALTLVRQPGSDPEDPEVIQGSGSAMAAFIKGLKGVPVEKETVLRRTD